MNLSEFKAWFEGYTEDMDGPPTAKQWKKIKARIEGIVGDPTPWPEFVKEYRRLQPQFPRNPVTVWQEGFVPDGAASLHASVLLKRDAFQYLGRADHQADT